MCSCSAVVKETLPHFICGVCNKPHNDPRILPCFHSFCHECLHHEMEKCKQVFKCPTCERNISIPVGGASALPQNLHLGFEVEVAGYMSKIVNNSEVCCDECVDGHNGPAKVFCCTCRQFLCKNCHDHHINSRKLSKHSMVGLDHDGAKQLQTTMKPRDHYCSQPNHECYKLKFYCETCDLLVCTDCTIGAHKDHAVDEVSTVAKTHHITIEDVLTEARGITIKMNEGIDRNDKMIEKVEISRKNALLAINQTFEILHQTLEERKKALLSELEAISLSKTTALALQKEQFRKTVEDIGHYTEVTSHILQTHTDYEVVALGGFIHTELKATIKKVNDMTPTPHLNIPVHIPTDDLVRELSKFGYIVELSPSSSTWTSTSAAKVGTKFQVKVESKTKNGNGYPLGDAQVKSEMRCKTHDGAVAFGEVEDHGDGTYTITLTPQTAGPHQLVILMDGQHVQNSPLDLDVRPKCDYRTLYKPQEVIYCSSHPLCIDIHDNGDIYVGCSDNCIYVFDQTGKPRSAIGSGGKNDGQFNDPRGLSIKGDVLYVADCGNNRIQRLTPVGKFIKKFSANSPAAVIVLEYNKIIVSNCSNRKIHIFNHNGGCLLTIDGDVIGNQCLLNPWGLALDPQGNIHVAATGSNTIKVFTHEGVYVRNYGDVKGPYGIAIDGEGYSLVCENGMNCLSIFDPDGKKIHTVKGLNGLRGVVLNSTDGSVFIANHDADIIMKYST